MGDGAEGDEKVQGSSPTQEFDGFLLQFPLTVKKHACLYELEIDLSRVNYKEKSCCDHLYFRSALLSKYVFNQFGIKVKGHLPTKELVRGNPCFYNIALLLVICS